MNITEFLEARIVEDEVIATLRGWHAEDCGWLPDESGYSYPCDCGVPERMAAECAAKREIIAKVQGLDFSLLEALAYVYKDHPDYDRNWRR